MKLSHPALNVNHQKAHSLLDRRDAERVMIRYRIIYSGDEGTGLMTGTGYLKDLSTTGCKVFGATMPTPGSNLTLFLDLEDGQTPLCLTSNTVSWVAGDSFAVRFPTLTSSDRKRLQGVIWRNVRVSSLTDRRTAFRLV